MIVLFVFGYMFYKLAYQYDKNPWFWGLAGAASYIVLQLLMGAGVGVLHYGLGLFPSLNETVLNIVGVIISGLIVYMGYRYFKNKWAAEDTRFDRNQINDIGKPED